MVVVLEEVQDRTLEELAQEREVAQERHLADDLHLLFAEQARDHDGLTVAERDVRVLGNHEDKLVSDALERVWVQEGGEERSRRAFVLDTRGLCVGEEEGGLERRATAIKQVAAAALGLDPAAVKVLVVALEAGTSHRA